MIIDNCIVDNCSSCFPSWPWENEKILGTVNAICWAGKVGFIRSSDIAIAVAKSSSRGVVSVLDSVDV